MNWDITFANPWWLLLLVAVPLAAIWNGRPGGRPSVVYPTTSRLRTMGRRGRSRTGEVLNSLLYFSLACFAVALARPQKGETITRTKASGIDIMLVLDVSKSMLAEDFTVGGRRANRFDAVKKVTLEFIADRPGDRMGIVAFAGRPYLVSPLTLDHDWLRENLDRVRIGLVEDGTAIGSAIASGASRLRDRESKSRILVLLTDGDNNAGPISPKAAAEAAATLGVKIYTIGAGSNGTARIPVGRDPFGREMYRNVRVDFDEESLREIAKIGNGQYFRATGTDSLESIFGEIDALEKTTIEVEQRENKVDLFPKFLAAGLGLLGLHLLLGQTALRRLP